MRVLGFWVLFVVLGTVSMFLAFSSSSFTDLAFSGHREIEKGTMTNRRLKENSYHVGSTKEKGNMVNISMEDYHLIDPVPSSKAAIKSGPIEHGTPLMPYIPQPTPPSHPRRGGPP